MIRFISFLVIVAAVWMWSAGESPRSLLHRGQQYMAVRSAHLAGESNDWGN
ncbi:hypothetical protein [Novosphingobium sp. Gsoil 351]|uniref:hypothetical protein n=1 Tax=Novosphingobium sp. Gsoil 351 TaxID=2675225 RepID=UPI0018A83781|nr:hypothetical protein [Novosphingobium sp. Gsoil 351]